MKSWLSLSNKEPIITWFTFFFKSITTHFFTIKPLLRKTLGIFYLTLIALLSLLPTSSFPDISYFSGEDKIIHFGMYAGLGFMACWSLNISSNRFKSYPLLLLFVFMWGVLMEILQRLMANGRSLEFMDMLANLGGAIVGLLAYIYMVKINKQFLFK